MGLAVAGLGRVRSPAERLLSLVALFLLVPIALSPANSPRNLSTGLVALLSAGRAALASLGAGGGGGPPAWAWPWP